MMIEHETDFAIIDAHTHLIERLAGYGARGEMRSIGSGMTRWATGEEETHAAGIYRRFFHPGKTACCHG